MSKLIKIILELLIVGVLTNLIAAWFLQDVWDDLFTPARIFWTILGVLTAIFFISYQENKKSKLPIFWSWHRFRYFRNILNDEELQITNNKFVPLDAVQTNSINFQDSERYDLPNIFLEFIYGKYKKTPRVLITGDPGSGKSVSLKVLKFKIAQRGVRRFGFGKPIPLLVRLSNVQDKEILDYLKIQFCQTTNNSGPVLGQGMEDLLKRGGIILLLDALDESLGQNREKVLSNLQDLIESRSLQKAPIIITSRAHQYPEKLFRDFEIYQIKELGDKAIDEFIRNAYPWLIYDNFNNSKLNRKKDELKQFLKPGGLGRNPFWLENILIVSGIVQQKSDILSKVFKESFYRELEKPETERSWQKKLTSIEQFEESKKALAWLAYLMTSKETVVLEKDDALVELESWLDARVGYGELKLHARDVIGLGQDCQILYIDQGNILYKHKIFQEFFAALALATHKNLLTRELENFSKNSERWPTLSILQDFVKDFQIFVEHILGDSQNISSVFFAFGLIKTPYVKAPPYYYKSNKDELTENASKIIHSFIDCVSNGITSNHIAAWHKLIEVFGEEIFDKIEYVLSLRNNSANKSIIKLLAVCGEPRAIESIIKTLGDNDLKDYAQKYLLQMGDAVIECLIRALGWDYVWWHNAKIDWATDENARIKEAFALRLKKMEKLYKNSKKAKEAELYDLEYLQKSQIRSEEKFLEHYPFNIDYISKKGIHEEEHQERMIYKNESNLEPQFYQIVDVIKQFGDTIIEPLTEAMNQYPVNDFLITHEYNQRICNGAALALGKIGGEVAMNNLINRLRTKWEWVSIWGTDQIYYVSKALKEIGSLAANKLIDILSDDVHILQKSAAYEILSNMDESIIVPLLDALKNGRLDPLPDGYMLLTQLAKNEENFDYIISSLDSQNNNLKTAALLAWRGLGEAVLPKLIDLFTDEHFSRYAVEGLAIIGPKAIMPLMERLNSSNNLIRSGALEALGEIAYQSGSLDQQIIDKIIKATRDKDRKVSESAWDALANLGDNAIEPIYAALNDTDPQVRLQSIFCLQQIYFKQIYRQQGNKINVIKPLTAALKDERLGIRLSAIYALLFIGEISGIKSLISIIPREQWKIRFQILYGISKIPFRKFSKFSIKFAKKTGVKIKNYTHSLYRKVKDLTLVST